MNKRPIFENTDVAGYTKRSDTPLDIAIQESLASKLTHIVKMDAIQTLIPAMTYSYNMDGNRGTQILFTTTQVPVGTQVVTSGPKSANVLFIDGLKILIDSQDIFDTTDILNIGGQVTRVYDNIKGRMPTISDFGLMALRNNRDQVTGGLDFKLQGVTLHANKMRKVKATATQEFIQDAEAVWGKQDIDNKVAEFTLSEIMYSIDTEIIKFLHDKATLEQQNPIELGNMLNNNGSFDTTQELFRLIEHSVSEISTKTMRPPKVFVIATPPVVSFLCAHPQFVPFSATEDKKNSYVRGELLGYLIINDTTGIMGEHYMLVGTYSEVEPSMSSAVLGIYNTIKNNTAIDPANGEVNIFTTVQYDVRHNPLDSMRAGDSAFTRKYKVDIGNIAVIPPVPPVAPFTNITINNIVGNALTILEADVYTLSIDTDADRIVVDSSDYSIAVCEGINGTTIRTIKDGTVDIKVTGFKDGYQPKTETITLTVRARPITILEIQNYSVVHDNITFTTTIPVNTNANTIDVTVDNPDIVEAIANGTTDITINSKAAGSTKVRITAKVPNGKLVERIVAVEVKSMPITTLVLSRTNGFVTIGSSLNPFVIDVQSNGIWNFNNKTPNVANAVRNLGKVEISPLNPGRIEIEFTATRPNVPMAQPAVEQFTGEVLPQPITNLVLTSSNTLRGRVGDVKKITFTTDPGAVIQIDAVIPGIVDIRKVTDTEYDVEFLQQGATDIEILATAFDAIPTTKTVQVTVFP